MDPKAIDLISTIDAVQPGFRDDCQSENNLYLSDDGNITVHGVWAYCSDWIRSRLGRMTAAQTQALASILNSQVGGAEENWTMLRRHVSSKTSLAIEEPMGFGNFSRVKLLDTGTRGVLVPNAAADGRRFGPPLIGKALGVHGTP